MDSAVLFISDPKLTRYRTFSNKSEATLNKVEQNEATCMCTVVDVMKEHTKKHFQPKENRYKFSKRYDSTNSVEMGC